MSNRAALGDKRLQSPLPFLFLFRMRVRWSKFKEEEEEDIFAAAFSFVCCWPRGWKLTKIVSPGLILTRSSSSVNAAPRRNMLNEDDDGEFSEGEQKKACAHFFLNSFTDKPEETSMTFVSELCCIVRTVIFILLSINRHKRPFPPKKRESFCCEEKTSWFCQVLVYLRENLKK